MTRKTAEASPVVRRLTELAAEFDQAAAFYARTTGSHNELLHTEALRAGAQLRLVREFVINGTYRPVQGVLWIRAAWRVITAIGRANLS